MSVDGETVHVSTPQARDTPAPTRGLHKADGVGLGAFRHQLEENLPPSDLLHHTTTLGSRHKALFERVTLTFEGALAVTLAFASLASVAPLSTFAFFVLALGGRAFALSFPLPPRNVSAQPTSLGGHSRQESQSRTRSHVLAALDSTCRSPPCAPSRLRTSSDQHYILSPLASTRGHCNISHRKS